MEKNINLTYAQKQLFILHNFPIMVLLKKMGVLPLDFNSHYRFPCPVHKGDNPTSCHINDKGLLHCWTRCKQDYNVISVYRFIRRVSLSFAIHKLYNFMLTREFEELIRKEKENNFTKKYSYSNLKKKEVINKKNNIYDDKLIYSFFEYIQDFYVNYRLSNYVNFSPMFARRGLKESTIRIFNLGASPFLSFSTLLVNELNKKNKKYLDLAFDLGLIKCYFANYHDTFKNSILIPVCDIDGNVVNFYQNNVLSGVSKYQSLPNVRRARLFEWPYGFNIAFQSILKTGVMIIHEGFYDTMQAYNHGLFNVASVIIVRQLFSQNLINLLKRHNIKVVIGYDNDPTGREFAPLLYKQLKKEGIKSEVRTIIKKYSNVKDPDELLLKYGPDAYKECYLSDIKKPIQKQNKIETVNEKKEKEENIFNYEDVFYK